MNTFWITGLSGAGKTTLALEIEKQLKASHQRTISLDGDSLREILGSASSNDKNHGREARLKLAMSYGRLSKYLGQQDSNIIISTISMFREVYEWNRKNISGYFEIYLDTSKEELRRRDPKGIYKQYDEGKLKNVAGEDLLIDIPNKPDFVVRSNELAEVPLTAATIIQKAQANGQAI